MHAGVDGQTCEYSNPFLFLRACPHQNELATDVVAVAAAECSCEHSSDANVTEEPETA